MEKQNNKKGITGDELIYLQKRAMDLINEGLGNKQLAQRLTKETGMPVSRKQVKRIRWSLAKR